MVLLLLHLFTVAIYRERWREEKKIDKQAPCIISEAEVRLEFGAAND